ncbi:MAG: hypothetical protein VKO44_05650, partial [Cyanobacteriota bacterium]|nr:hypothetical protein [Cyanobacteriota bacterium]
MSPVHRQRPAHALTTTPQGLFGGPHPRVHGRGARRPRRRPLGVATLALVAALILWQGLAGASLAAARPAAAVGTPSHPLPQSSEVLASRSIWSRPESYPLSQQPRADLYRPSAEWIGRLQLPTPAETSDPLAPKDDWVWIVVEQTPAAEKGLIGERLRLR